MDNNQQDQAYENEYEKPSDKPITEDLDFTKPDFQFVENSVHEFYQQGVYVICKACSLEHAVYIGRQKIMIGRTERGFAILKDR